MGYTHYWHRVAKDFEEKKWNLFLEDVKKVADNLPKSTEGEVKTKERK